MFMDNSMIFKKFVSNIQVSCLFFMLVLLIGRCHDLFPCVNVSVLCFMRSQVQLQTIIHRCSP